MFYNNVALSFDNLINSKGLCVVPKRQQRKSTEEQTRLLEAIHDLITERPLNLRRQIIPEGYASNREVT